DRADERVERRDALEGRVDGDVEDEREGRDRRRQGRGQRQREVGRPAYAEGKPLERAESARREGPILRASHAGIGVLLEPLVQGARPGGDEGRPEDGM